MELFSQERADTLWAMQAFKERIAAVPGAPEFLLAVGFVFDDTPDDVALVRPTSGLSDGQICNFAFAFATRTPYPPPSSPISLLSLPTCD